MVWTGTKAEYDAWLQSPPSLPPIPRIDLLPRRRQPDRPAQAVNRSKPVLTDQQQEAFMLDALERLDAIYIGDRQLWKAMARLVLDDAHARLPKGDRLAVIEEEASALIHPMAQRPASAQTQIGRHGSIGDGKPLMGGENGNAEKPGGRNPVTVPLVSQTCSSAPKARR